MYLRVASPSPVGNRLFCHMAENRGRRAKIMLGPAQTSIQLVMPSGPQAFLIFFLSFFRALRTADLVIGEASFEVSEKMDGMESETSL